MLDLGAMKEAMNECRERMLLAAEIYASKEPRYAEVVEKLTQAADGLENKLLRICRNYNESMKEQ